MKSAFLALLFTATQAIKLTDEPGYKLEVKSFGQTPGGMCKDGDTVSVWYTGKLLDGTEFDSNVNSGDLFKFTLGQGMVISCWDTSLAQMKVGEKATLTCPSDMAYGERGAGDKIPPNATLKFDVEVANCENRF